MWESLSLRTRLLLPLGLMFGLALLLGAVSLQIFAPAQLLEEAEPAARAARSVAAALNGALQTSANPQATLDAFVQSLGSSEAIRFRRADEETSVHPPIEVRTLLGRVPHWFVHLVEFPEIVATHPVTIEGKRVGDIVFAPDMSADIYEKWVGFLAIASSGIALMLLTGIIAHFAARSALGPLQNLGDGLTRMRMGDYEHLIPATGPPEIRKSSLEANELARTLGRLSQDNRSLLRRIVSLQDDERRDMARELHDELGPLLFGIRANTVALLEAIPAHQSQARSRGRGNSPVGRDAAAGKPPHPRPAATALHPGTGTGAQYSDIAAEREGAGAGPYADVGDRRHAEHGRRLAVADGLSRDPGGSDERASSRQSKFDARSGSRSRTVNWSLKYPTMALAFPPIGCWAAD